MLIFVTMILCGKEAKKMTFDFFVCVLFKQLYHQTFFRLYLHSL